MRAPRHRRSGLLCAAPLAAALALAGCALNQPPDREALRADAMPSVKAPGAWVSPGGAPGAVQDDWLATFGDEQLRALVFEALASNFDIRLAAARVERAAAYAKQAGSTLYPQVNLLASGSFTGSDSGSAFETAGLFASWELDLWGRVRAQAQAGSTQYEATEKDSEFARQSIAALVAKSWFLAIEARRQRAIAQEMSAAGESIAGLARERSRIGKGDEYDVRLAQAGLQGYRDSVLQLQLAEQQAIRAIETLVGRYPAAALDTAPQFPKFPGPVPAGLPSELLERRLDVAAAERRVASAYYLVGEAQAARLPRISLTASGSSITSDLVFLKDRENPAWSAGGNIMLPLFAGGALRRRWKFARPSRRRPSPTTGASARVPSRKSRTRSRRDSTSRSASLSWSRRSPRTSAPSSSRRCAIESAPPTSARCSSSSSPRPPRGRLLCGPKASSSCSA